MRICRLSRVAALSGLLASSLLMNVAANAQSRGTGWEFGADVIYQDSQDIEFNGGSSASLDDDFGLAITFGYRFNDKLELQFGLDWQDVDYDAILQSAPPNAPQSFDVSGSLEAFTPRVSVHYNFMTGPLTPYVSAGIGWSFVDTNIPDGRPQNVCYWDPWWGYICGTVQDTRNVDAFTYQFGAGVRWDLNAGYSLRLGYEKQWLDLEQVSSTPDFDHLKLGITYRY